MDFDVKAIVLWCISTCGGLRTVEIRGNVGGEIHRNFLAGAISLQICWAKLRDGPYMWTQFHLFLKVHPTLTFRVESGEKLAYLVCLAKRLTRTHRVWEPDNFLGKSPWKDICIFIT